MSTFGNVFANLLGSRPETNEMTARRHIQRAWDRERSRALTPSHRAEVDAIFSRYL